MNLYDWTSDSYVDLLQLAFDWHREGLIPHKVLGYLVEYCLEHEIPVPVTDLQHLVDLAFRAVGPS